MFYLPIQLFRALCLWLSNWFHICRWCVTKDHGKLKGFLSPQRKKTLTRTLSCMDANLISLISCSQWWLFCTWQQLASAFTCLSSQLSHSFAWLLFMFTKNIPFSKCIDNPSLSMSNLINSFCLHPYTWSLLGFIALCNLSLSRLLLNRKIVTSMIHSKFQ